MQHSLFWRLPVADSSLFRGGGRSMHQSLAEKLTAVGEGTPRAGTAAQAHAAGAAGPSPP